MLPVESVLPELLLALSDPGRAVLVAPPGAGKTTLVPPALLDEPWVQGGRIVMLEPRRLAARGFSAKRFRLSMTRTDIASYLRLASETVSRVLSRFQEDGLLGVERRDVELLQPAQLEALARSVLRE